MIDNDRLQELFDHAVLLNASERTDFIARETAGDAALASAIRGLLAADEESSQNLFWERSALENEALRAKNDPPVTDRIGPYQIIELIGSGGMGQVFRARRVDAEYNQIVAIKRIRQSFLDSELSARFRTERQILADLDHPHIARLLDGGTDAQGLPYLVMEFIEGESLTSFCQTRRLPLPDRLRLFQEICSAVQYAHRHMVIHRDLKPANILVSKDCAIKLLDFGIAKLISATPESKAADTVAVMLTPGYASPEQVRGQPLTTASDIYSLGVILYELLTGESPYGQSSPAPHELMDAVCRLEPIKPSDVAKPWRRKLRGDLDNIVMKALKKDPRERYASVDQLSDDIRRHLTGLPVTARGESFGYVAGKYLRRHKAATLAAALILAALVGGIISTKRAERRAERRFNQVRKLSHAVVFDYHDAIEALPGSTPLRQQLVKDALEYLDSLASEADDPSLQRELMDAYIRISQDEGNSYHANLGDTKAAMASAGKAIAIGQKLLKKNPTPEGRQSLAAALEAEADLLYGADKLTDAENRYGQAIGLREQVMQEQPTNSGNLAGLAGILRKLGDLNGAAGTINLGRSQNAVELYQRAVQVTDKLVALKPTERVAKKERFNVLLALASAQITAASSQPVNMI